MSECDDLNYSTRLENRRNTVKPAEDQSRAATASRLSPDRLSDVEKHLFPVYRRPTIRSSYTYARNLILALWQADPTLWITKEEAIDFVSGGQDKEFDRMVRQTYDFLMRYRYINFGVPDRLPPALPPPCNDAARPPRIVIIGSGVAGLTAAREIKNLFVDCPHLPAPNITVLEGRKRMGGRVFTYPLMTRPDGTQSSHHCGIDLGAQIVTGFEGGNPLDAIVKSQLELPLHYLLTSGDVKLYDSNGQVVSQKADEAQEQLFNDVLDSTCHTVIQGGVPTVVSKQQVQMVCKQEEENGYSSLSPSLETIFAYHLSQHPQFQQLQPAHLRVINWHLANLEYANACPLKKLSLHHWDQDDPFEFEGPHCNIKGGFGQLVSALANGSNPEHDQIEIHYDKAVDQIEVKGKVQHADDHLPPGPVKITCKDGSEYTADAVVVTVSLGVLKANTIAFNPPLPDWKTEAIDRLNMGLFNKVVMVFPKLFWKADVDSFGSLNDPIASGSRENALSGFSGTRGRFFLFWNMYPSTGVPILMSFISGEAALEMEHQTDREIVDQALDVLSGIFSSQRPLPKPIETMVTRWGQDEFSRGSYSCIGNGATGRDHDRLSKSIDNKIFWAGEATSRQYPATVHGALLSGMRVATEITNVLLGNLQSASLGKEPKKAKENEGNPELDATAETEPQESASLPLTPRCCLRSNCRAIIPENLSYFDHCRQEHPESDPSEAPYITTVLGKRTFEAVEELKLDVPSEIPAITPKVSPLASPKPTAPTTSRPMASPAPRKKRDSTAKKNDAAEVLEGAPEPPPKNPFLLFKKEKLNDVRKYLADNNLRDRASFPTILGQWWNQRTPDEKKAYELRWSQMREQYEEQAREYRLKYPHLAVELGASSTRRNSEPSESKKADASNGSRNGGRDSGSAPTEQDDADADEGYAIFPPPPSAERAEVSRQAQREALEFIEMSISKKP
ncbi:flavin-containing amine oxidoreductase-domain containing protein [Polychytrium aggregatum]|uniref:flavin-containing amine oxidoreductase-domain containing protein n=1 Tax=Polychytrium aggregatum TaxID=110093 RepID=UPI0022FDD5ED|nr:flavin-containing amine oxidoreductase-domain containing protein [Polychytrium aggregatum]KAI9193427.1 flavin-containing amine oxidoreductase-domain containing protein [Polychytrium aggregatum]